MKARGTIMAGVATLLIALPSVSYQAVRAVVADPVKSLWYEKEGS